MALTADTDRRVIQCSGVTRRYPVAASDIFYKGAFLALNTSGNLIVAADTASLTFAGVCKEQVDNASGAAAALEAEVYIDGIWRVTMTGAVAGDVGTVAYMTDDDTVDDATAATNDRPVGLITDTETNIAWVDIGGVASRAYGSNT